jgi:autophagy-related protein 5
MADDREILREVWDGRIPVRFNLAHGEIDTLEEPEPYFVMIILINLLLIDGT